MPYLILAMIIGITGFLIIRAVKKKNNSKSHNDIKLDRPFDSKLDAPESGTKHSIQSEAKQDDEHAKRF
ncbi:FeoB-associated Cys-rich membrane protein [Domibacillus iocasae]|uniref:DUF3951 domain-containing protein n=1 Tax=Domibacillus iocasae TaxID=1714016 RepID=A0A1E7DU53_9BACI|nr:FeoB-associated Cys-rich membrane protein [Domibacillus iocasae]OES46613.1 hypothetical protein BA724_00715 [Domibacillus iocasae]